MDRRLSSISGTRAERIPRRNQSQSWKAGAWEEVYLSWPLQTLPVVTFRGTHPPTHPIGIVLRVSLLRSLLPITCCTLPVCPSSFFPIALQLGKLFSMGLKSLPGPPPPGSDFTPACQAALSQPPGCSEVSTWAQSRGFSKPGFPGRQIVNSDTSTFQTPLLLFKWKSS